MKFFALLNLPEDEGRLRTAGVRTRSGRGGVRDMAALRDYLAQYRESIGFVLIGVVFGVASLSPWAPLREVAANALVDLAAFRVVALLAIPSLLLAAVVGLLFGKLRSDSGTIARWSYEMLVVRPLRLIAGVVAPSFWAIAGAGTVMAFTGDWRNVLIVLTFLCLLFLAGGIPAVGACLLTEFQSPSTARWLRNGRIVGLLLLLSGAGLLVSLLSDSCLRGAC